MVLGLWAEPGSSCEGNRNLKPQLLGLSIEENLKPTAEWFLDIGLSQAQVVKVIAGSPSILGLSIEENLRPTVQWFSGHGAQQ